MPPKSREAQTAFWRRHLTEWRASGLSQAAYCRLHGLPLKAMSYRNRTVIMEGAPLRKMPAVVSSSVTIVPVPMSRRPAEPLPPLRVVVCERYRIDVGGDFDPGVLAKLVRTLEEVA